jgi:hypothetical protein
MRTRARTFPLIGTEPGMVLGTAVAVVNHRILRYTLPAEHKLTQDDLRQLRANGAEFVYVAEPETRSDEEIAEDVAQAARSVLDIFADADLSDPILAALFEQVLAYRSA